MANFCDYTFSGALEPCTIVIFGASGDLTSRMLVPALYRMFCTGSLPQAVAIVGTSRTPFSHEQFRFRMREAVAANVRNLSLERWHEFSARLFYQAVLYDSLASFQDLANFLGDLDRRYALGGNRLFDLAVPPPLYPVIAGLLGQAGLAAQQERGNGWARIVVEKPFGRDLESAMELDRILHLSFAEEQIFRIDHYLAKETVQNLLIFRFANSIFEPLWNRGFIESVGIIAAEKIGVEHRAGYYEESGVIRDMFQNHMLQLLALTAMEPPSRFEAGRVRDEKVKVYRALRALSPKADENLILGQYGPGEIDGQMVPGYLQENGVEAQSLTPTFAMMRLFIDNWRWQGVPFYLISGKRLRRKDTRIVIQFKEVPHAMFRDVLSQDILANRLVLNIHPEEAIRLTFQAKKPGAKVCLRSMTMDFNYQEKYEGLGLDAYEKVLLDCILGDHMLFWRQDGVELCWSLLTPILNACETCGDRRDQLHVYPAGSWGPEEARGVVEGIVR